MGLPFGDNPADLLASAEQLLRRICGGCTIVAVRSEVAGCRAGLGGEYRCQRLTAARPTAQTFVATSGTQQPGRLAWMASHLTIFAIQQLPWRSVRSERQGSAAIARPYVSVDDLGRLQPALFDSDLDAVAERPGKAAEGLAEDSECESRKSEPPKSAVTRES